MIATDISNYTVVGEIPLSKNPNQSFQIVLDGQNCTINVYQKDDTVYVDLFVDTLPVFYGLSALDRVGIKLSEYMNFKGQLWFEDQNGTQNPDYTGFGERYLFYYGK